MSSTCRFAVVGSEVRPEQRRVHALPQGPPDPPPHPGHLGRQRNRGEHGRVAQGKIKCKKVGENILKSSLRRQRFFCHVLDPNRKWECRRTTSTSWPGCFRTLKCLRTSISLSKKCINTTSWLYQVKDKRVKLSLSQRGICSHLSNSKASMFL